MLCLMSACWRRQVVAPSPDRKTAVNVYYAHGGADIHVKITLARGDNEITVRPPDGDRVPEFIEVGWSRDSSRFGLFICDQLSGNILFGYDQIRARFLTRSETEALIRGALRIRYHLVPASTGRETDWACSSEGRSTFARMLKTETPLVLKPIPHE